MKTTLFAASLCLIGTVHATSIIPAQSSSYEDFPASTITVPGMETMTAQQDRRSMRVFSRVQYAEKSNYPLHVTVIQPADGGPSTGSTMQDSGYPVIAFVQGSAWFKQHLEKDLTQLSRLAERGYVIALIEYRPSTVAPFPAQVEDTKTALHWLGEHAHEYGGNFDKLILWGTSSGGHTVSMVGTTLDTKTFDAANAPSLPVKAVIDYYGPTAVDKMNEEPSTYDHIQPDSPEGMLLGQVNVLENKDKARLAAPMTYISKEEAMPPFLIVHGDKDRKVPFGQSALLFNTLVENGHDARLIKLQGGDHGGAPFWQDDTLDVVDQFIQSKLM